jgi:hypothetical protein
LNLYPAPNKSGLFNNYASNPVVNNDTDQFDVRVDQSFSAKDNAFARVSYVNNPTSSPGPFGDRGWRRILCRKSEHGILEFGAERNARILSDDGMSSAWDTTI